MINELREIRCPYCKNLGYKEREEITDTIVVGNEIKNGIYWKVKCEICGQENKIYWESY